MYSESIDYSKPSINSDTPKKILILASDNVQILDISGLMSVFSNANKLYQGRQLYDVELVGVNSAAIYASCGLEITPKRSILDLSHAERQKIDTFFAVGENQPTRSDYRLINFIKELHQTTKRIAALSTGVFLLAKAGILDGKRATTHWAYLDILRENFPKIQVDPKVLYVVDQNTWTSAGASSAVDMALACVKSDYGNQLAYHSARWHILHMCRPGSQSQFSPALIAQSIEHRRLTSIIQWIFDNPQEDLSITSLANRAAMSERSFIRHFIADVGMPPGKFIEQVRLEKATIKLEQSDTPLEKVASYSGFKNSQQLRRSFFRHKGILPSEYRERFQPVVNFLRQVQPCR